MALVLYLVYRVKTSFVFLMCIVTHFVHAGRCVGSRILVAVRAGYSCSFCSRIAAWDRESLFVGRVGFGMCDRTQVRAGEQTNERTDRRTERQT